MEYIVLWRGKSAIDYRTFDTKEQATDAVYNLLNDGSGILIEDISVFEGKKLGVDIKIGE